MRPEINREGLNTFIADVYSLKLHFPVPTIAKRTGETKINVNAYFRNLRPAPRRFLDIFYYEFREELQRAKLLANKSAIHVQLPPSTKELVTLLTHLEKDLSATMKIVKAMHQRERR